MEKFCMRAENECQMVKKADMIVRDWMGVQNLVCIESNNVKRYSPKTSTRE